MVTVGFIIQNSMNLIHEWSSTFQEERWYSFYIYGLSLVFVKQLLDNSFYLVLYFLYLSLLSLDYLVKRFILLDFTFFSFYDYYVCFINLQKFPKCYSWIIFKLIFLYLINFGADFCWLITTKGCSACWL